MSMTLPPYSDTVELIESCIKSCRNQFQIATCREMIDRFIVKRYEHYESAATIAVQLTAFNKLIEDQRAIMVDVAQRETVYN